MAITIVQNLQASPNPTTLPRRVEFRQTLRSTRATGEDIEVVYSLAPAIPFFFLDLSNAQVKQILRRETVGPQDQVCVDRMTMVQAAGSPAFASVQIDQTIKDAAGNVQPDLCVLNLV